MSRAVLTALVFICLSVVSAEAGPVTLAWDPNTEPDLDGYLLSYGTASGQYTTTIDLGNLTSYVFSTPNPTQRYYVALRAYNTAGGISPYSNEVVIDPVTLPLTVTGISSNRTSPQPVGTAITFAAAASGGTTPYQFKWWIVNGGASTVGRQWSTSNTFTWTPTSASTNYRIRVWARNASSTADQADNPAAIFEMTFVITTTVTNLAPTVSAGADKTITLPSSVTITGTTSDDGKPNPPGVLTRGWTKVSGPGTVTFTAPTAVTTAAGFSTSGTYVLRLTASDSALSASDDVTVTVNPASTANQPPTVSAGADKTITLPSSVSLTGTTSDDGKPNPPGVLTRGWTKVSGPGTVTFTAPTAVTTAVGFSTSGTYVLRLTAWDGALSTSDDVSVTVNPASTANQPPTVSAGADMAITLPSSGTLTGTTSDDGKPNPPGVLTRGWTKVSGPGTVTFTAPTAVTTAAGFSTSGIYVLRLTASDGAMSVSDDVTVAVNPASTANQPPTVNAGADKTITLPSGVTFTGTTSDDGKPNPPGVLTRGWTKVSGPGTVTFTAPTAATTAAGFSTSGTYVLRLTASDGALSASDDVAVTVNAGASGTGLTGQYWLDSGAGTHFAGVTGSRIDSAVNFNWGMSGLAPGAQTDFFSVRWTGQVLAPISGSYRFATTSDDGVRLWVNGQLVIDNWTEHTATVNTSPAINLVEGVRYAIKLEYYERTGPAQIQLRWTPPGQAEFLISSMWLFP